MSIGDVEDDMQAKSDNAHILGGGRDSLAYWNLTMAPLNPSAPKIDLDGSNYQQLQIGWQA